MEVTSIKVWMRITMYGGENSPCEKSRITWGIPCFTRKEEESKEKEDDTADVTWKVQSGESWGWSSGELSGKFDYYVLYPQAITSCNRVFIWNLPVLTQEQSDAVLQLCTEMAAVILNETETPEQPPQNDDWECNMISAGTEICLGSHR